MRIHHRIVLTVGIVATLAILSDKIREYNFTRCLMKRRTSCRASSATQTPLETLTAPHESYVEVDSNRHHRCSTETLTDKQLPIDHSHKQSGTYLNRYWVNDEFYSPGGPVFVHDVGEIDAQSSARRYLQRSSSYLRQYLKDFHGLGIVWEHRYYGNSLPYPVNQSTPPELFRFLTINQSLSDLPFFAQNFHYPPLAHVDLTPASTPWVIIGCSYSGLRAALSRQRFPDTFYAAYAASAPVQLQVKLNKFFDPVYDKLVDRGHQNCARDLHVAMQHLDILLSTPHNALIVKRRLLGPGAEVNNNGDFTLAMANIYSYFQSYGISGGAHSLVALCEYLEHDPVTGSAVGGLGISELYGRQAVFDRFASWPGLVAIVNDHFDTNCSITGKAEETSCDLGRSAQDVSGISWTWQLCSELGLMTTQNSGLHSLVSRYQSLEYRKSICARQFPSSQQSHFLPSTPMAERINNETGGWLMRPSNVFWTAGQYDPWRSLTTLVVNASDGAQSRSVNISQLIPSCGVSTEKDTVFGYVMEDAQHCLDYSSDAEEALKSRELFGQALRQWLPCFRPQ